VSAIRCFVGVPLPAAYQALLGDIARRVKPRLKSRTTWTREGGWHLTLKFLGDVEEDLIGTVREALAEVAFAPFTLQAAGAGFFPPRREDRRWSPRVIWVGVSVGAAEAVRLAADVDEAAAALGFAPEARPFAPHLTLARVKQPAPDPWAEVLAEVAGRPWPPFTVDRFVLWQSTLGPGGSEHTALAEFPARAS